MDDLIVTFENWKTTKGLGFVVCVFSDSGSPEGKREESAKMVARKFQVQHNGSTFDLDYDTDDGFEVLKFQLFSLTSIPPDEQQILGGDDELAVSDDSDLELISHKLRLLVINDVHEAKNEADFEKSDEELARMLQAEEEALMMQQFVASDNREQVEQRIRRYIDQVLMYEDPHRQEAARKTVPVEKLEEKALISLAREGNFRPTKNELDHSFLLQLLFWFKQSFRWVNAPPCDSCNNETVSQGMGVANQSESLYGASRIELYRCKSCSNVTRFPRYSDPIKLLETRRGRCGEWANCFTLYCRAFGYESRLILDFTDHVWTECFSYLGRWMHLDPCEGIYDNPLLYEKGWNKKLDYVIAIAKDGVYDVTKRYTKRWHDVLSRRVITTESTLATVISNITRERRKNMTSEMLSDLDKRDRSEAEELEKSMFAKDDASISLPGRQSGDKEWCISRSEFISDGQYSLNSACPVRRCVDEHVTKIYSAFSPLISEFIEKSLDKARAVELLDTFRRILVNLKNSPFKTRRTTTNAVSNGARSFIGMLPHFSQLLDALSLKAESGVKGTTDICLGSDPVKTSVALPVVFHALDDIIYNINHCGKLTKESLSWPLLKLNRICSGVVLASGEELPFGIVTSAFDGTRMSKWKEPNGATGCWVIYKVHDNRKHELVAYELMSTNDAPEADPMEWVVEGSEDGGSTWHILDKRVSQTFNNRFQRRTFEVKSQGLLANSFRFRFLAVRDVKATSQLQVGSIDLYARNPVSNIC